MRKILSYPSLRRRLANFGAWYIDLIFRTTRWQPFGDDTRELRALLSQGPVLFCVWHGRLVMMPKFWPAAFQLYVIGSTHRDGQLALAAAERYSIKTIDRPRKARTASTARAILRTLDSGGSVGITPDGSRGPRMRVKRGVIDLARLSGAPIVPATYSCSNSFHLASWDRFVLPLPFGRGVFRIGTPIRVDKNATSAELETARDALECQLNAMTEAADRAVGCRPVKPAEPIRPHGKSRPQATEVTNGEA